MLVFPGFFLRNCITVQAALVQTFRRHAAMVLTDLVTPATLFDLTPAAN